MKRLLLATGLATSAISCQTVPQPTVAEDLVLERVYCGLTDDIDFAYDPHDPVISDTLETIEQLREHNATRDLVCKRKDQ